MKKITEEEAEGIALKAIENFWDELAPLLPDYPGIYARALFANANTTVLSYGADVVASFRPTAEQLKAELEKGKRNEENDR